MEQNVALYILMYMVQCSVDGGGVRLSDYRNAVRIPRTTFYRHVNSLIEMKIIARVGRDIYTLNDEFVNAVTLCSDQKKPPAFQWNQEKE